MTLDELKELFGRHGVVKHAVILAVLDAFRRRRGFIVMNSNAEAGAAMKAMSGSVILYATSLSLSTPHIANAYFTQRA